LIQENHAPVENLVHEQTSRGTGEGHGLRGESKLICRKLSCSGDELDLSDAPMAWRATLRTIVKRRS
jgi:hypothetical protein